MIDEFQAWIMMRQGKIRGPSLKRNLIRDRCVVLGTRRKTLRHAHGARDFDSSQQGTQGSMSFAQGGSVAGKRGYDHSISLFYNICCTSL